MPDKLNEATQASFGGGLNAVAASHLLAPDEVQTTTNVDYSLEWGGAPCRRGSVRYGADAGLGTNTVNVQLIARNYALSTGVWNDTVIPWYVGADSGTSYYGSGSGTVTLTTISGYAGGSQTQVFPAFTQYGSYAYIANGTAAFKTNGTATYDWLIPQPDTPTVTYFQQGTFTGTTASQAGAFTVLTGTFTATEGTITGTSTSSYFGNSGGVIVSTCTTGTGTRIVIIGTPAYGNMENDVFFVVTPTGTGVTYGAGTYTLGGAVDFHQGYPGGDTTGTYTGTATITETMTVGPYGTDYMLLGLTNQQSVVTIQRDLSYGDATFTNYWHAETAVNDIHDATSDSLVLLLNAQGNSTIDVQQDALNQSRAITPNVGRRLGPSIPQIRRAVGKTSIAVNISPWGVARGDYQFIGTVPNPTFRSISAVRLIIEFNTPGQQALVGGLVTYGAQGWCLNDQVAGIQYFQTYARVENGFIVAEGAPSLPSPATRAQYAYAGLVCAASTNTTAGITHRVFYRTGGLLQDAHRVGSCTITSGTNTIYDYALPDMLIVSNPSLKRFLWSSWPSPTAGTGLPGVNAVSEPWQSRVFVGVQNQLYWSVPGIPSQIQDDVQTTVSDVGDPISAIIPYGNLVIVNRSSCYEFAGSVFEGENANFSLQRTASRRGSAAPKTCIKTPAGILLFNFDGISLYRAGFGVDQELDWAQEKLGDLWKGTGASDPAALRGRIPALNHAAIYNACAAYKDERIYLAVPTGTNTQPDTLFVLHLNHRKVWMFTYPFKILSLFYDKVQNRLMAGTDRGTIQQLETGLTDTSVTNSASGIAWSFQTRSWSTPTDLLCENLQVEAIGTHTAYGLVDGGTSTLGTFTQTAKAWSPESLQGTIGDAVSFQFKGTQSGTRQEITQAQWEFIAQTPKVTYFKTDNIAVPSENYVKTWLFDADCLGTATVTATLLVNGSPHVLANGTATTTTLSGSTRKVFELTLPNITVGKTIQAVYSSPNPFNYYDTQFEFEAKPFEKLSWLVTYKRLGGATQLDMARFFAMDIEGTLTATVTNTWLIDGSAFTTNTFTLSGTNAGEASGVGRMYADQVPFPPGARGYLFQQQVTSSQPFRVWKAHLDIDRIGVKGLSRVTLAGTPAAQG